MTFLSGRRLITACVVTAAAAVAVVAPGTASASPDLLQQCAGEAVKGHGSTFQAPILVKWSEEFNTSLNAFACSGTQGSTGKPKVEYLHTGADAGSGACLHGWGAESTGATDYGEFGFCGTDEAPNPTQKSEIEKHATGGETNSLETIPVLQGAVAIVVHLPVGCLASSEIEKSGKIFLLGRLVLDDSSIDKVYRGEITNWKQLLENQEKEGGAGKDKLVCKLEAEEEKTITPVVRLDHSGTTHIFKAFLEQVDSTPVTMEEYPETLTPAGRGKSGCTKPFNEESLPWKEVAEGCQNQRWPKAAKVEFGTEKGNPGVIKAVNNIESSIGYADLAVAREEGLFSGRGYAEKKVTIKAGENKKGSATKVGEQNIEFWAEVQNSATPKITGFADPSSDGDAEKIASSNCKNTVYSNEAGKKFPPASTREPWNQAKAELVQTGYAICGLTYDLALRQYKFYPGTTKGEATSVENFLRWAVNTKAEGGESLKNTDYEKLPGTIIKEDEKGLEEIGFETA